MVGDPQIKVSRHVLTFWSTRQVPSMLISLGLLAMVCRPGEPAASAAMGPEGCASGMARYAIRAPHQAASPEFALDMHATL
jgi:hypothetical protein